MMISFLLESWQAKWYEVTLERLEMQKKKSLVMIRIETFVR